MMSKHEDDISNHEDDISNHEDDISNHKDDIDDWKALEHHHFFLLCIHLFFVDGCCHGPLHRATR